MRHDCSKGICTELGLGSSALCTGWYMRGHHVGADQVLSQIRFQRGDSRKDALFSRMVPDRANSIRTSLEI